jgi:hypothetical protein
MALGDVLIKGKLKVEGTTEMAGGAKDATMITNLCAQKLSALGCTVSTDGTLYDNADTHLPTEKAVKTYADTGLALKANDNAVVKLTGIQTVAGAKTFSDSVIANITGNLTGHADGILETGAGAHTLKCKVIDINDWNMDADYQKPVAHGLGASFKNIRKVIVVIRNDTDDTYCLLDAYNGMSTPGKALGGVYSFTDTWIYLHRATGETFDSTAFDATSYNRGWVTIWYEA